MRIGLRLVHTLDLDVDVAPPPSFSQSNCRHLVSLSAYGRALYAIAQPLSTPRTSWLLFASPLLSVNEFVVLAATY